VAEVAWRRELRRREVGSVTEGDGGLVKWKTLDGRPEIQGIAVTVAGEAVIDLPCQMNGEVSAGG
jgi:hypothetical protein